jgi:ribosomal protein L35
MAAQLFAVGRSFASYFKLKTHSGLKKRLRVVGPPTDLQFKFYPVGKHHLNECKSKNNLSRKRNPKFLTALGDISQIKRAMPYWKKLN